MLAVETALERITDAFGPLAGEWVELGAAAGRVLVDDLCAPRDQPPRAISAMDGYAIRCADLNGSPLPISQRVPAGVPPQPLQLGTAARIFTGAQIPAGADAVVMQERCELSEAGVAIQTPAKPGDNIRRAGEDLAVGCEVLAAGRVLRPAALGLAASVGCAKLTVFTPVRVALFFTGDELMMPGEALRPGAIYNSNRFVLRALLEDMGIVVRDLGIVADDLAQTQAALRDAAHGADLVLTCGGVSVGEEDHVKAAVQAEGELDTWKIAIKPGKPLAFGRVANTPFIGLPGNPVSAFVTFVSLVQPYLRKRQGLSEQLAPAVMLRADFAWPKADARREFLRVRRNANGGLDLHPRQGSGVLSSCDWADGLVSNPGGQVIAVGDSVAFHPLGAGQ